MSKDDSAINRVVELFSSLTNSDAVKIFLLSEKGIRSATETRKAIGLTQRQYYSYLKKLKDSGLVEKKGGVYSQTILGRLCQKAWLSLYNAVLQGDRLSLADELLKSPILSLGEKEKVIRSISERGSSESVDYMDMVYSVKTIVNYDVFIKEVVKLLNVAKDIAYVVTNKTDLRVKDATMAIIDRGVKLYFLSLEMKFSENMELLHLLMNPASVGLIRKLLTSRELNVRVVKNLSYCFVIVDGKHGILELPNPISNEFYVAFHFSNAYLCQQLINVFHSLYDKASEDPRIRFARRALGLYQDQTRRVLTRNNRKTAD
jgi:DNA-binding transcriptional ArsR family regulator